MPLKKHDVTHRAWNLLRFSLLWARKGGMFRRKVMMNQLRLVPKYLKRLGHTAPTSQINYFERELSFDETPIFHVKMHRPSSMRFSLPHIPCINPHVDFDYDFNDNDDAIEYDNGYEGCKEIGSNEEEEQEGIDERAEEFIAQFYQQMKLQRQISYLQYNETPRKDNN
ncbi:unnamed protein product [Lupinus luteus]|uniref:Cotton fiber protein n=1 Tax=Lupinus luteus TaxID=3873 RepID=A0AAV1VT90_LUPLU